MYGPIANLPGYNPNATYLPPGMAAPSSYPERTAPRQQFYDMAPLPSVVDQSVMDLAGSGLSSADPYDSAFGPTGISGGIGGPDGKEYKFLNDFIGYLKQPQTVPPVFSGPQQMVPPNFTGPSNDQYSGEYLVPPVFAGPQQPPRRVGTVSYKEGDDIGGEMVPPVFAGPSADYGYGALGDLQQYYQQPQQTRTGMVSAQEGGQLYAGSPTTYDFPQSMQGFGLPSLQSLADKNGVIDTYSSTSMPGMFSSRWFDSLTNSPNSFTMGNAAQLGINALLPAGLSQLVSAGAGALGIGTNDTGNPVLNYLSQPSFGVGTNNMPSLPGSSQVMTDRGATGIDWANMSPAERSAEDAYGRSDVYNKDGSGWQMGAPAYSATPVDNTWSGNNPAAWGFNAEPWAGDFGAGRYDAGFTPSEWQINQGIIDNWAPQTYQLPMSPIMPIDPGASWFAPPELGNWADDELPMFGPGGRYGTGRWSTD